MARPANLTGKRFGRLVVLERIYKDRSGNYHWLCRCDCGNETESSIGNLTSGRCRSCGCLCVEIGRAVNTTHGASYTREYIAYHHAKKRCEDTEGEAYKNYGGRGIKFLFTSFEQFFSEIGPKPHPSLTLDRINNNGNYEPGNVRWATRIEQVRNSRTCLGKVA